MKTKILEELKKNEGYISGQDLCEKCNVSRTAIWKVINQLKAEGYEIHSVSNKGYKIISYPDILSKSEIQSSLSESKFVKEVVYLETVDSTNNKAKALGEEGALDGTLIVSEFQQSGKGRRGKGFQSPKGDGIYMTLLLRPEVIPAKASMITIVAAMAVREGLFNACNIEGKIKWPNDIVVEGKKICGILTEMSSELDYVNHVVVGMGINVNNNNMPDYIKDVAISVKMITGKEYKRSIIIAEVIRAFEKYYKLFLKSGDLKNIKGEYNENLIHFNQEVVIIKGNEKYTAKSLGIDNDGELLIKREGVEEKVISGEVSVRGVYGYV